jgi:hypothetical protein
MIRDKYVLDQLQGRDYTNIPEDAARRTKKRDAFLFEKPLAPETLLRSTEDFSPVLEIAFRSGVTDAQSKRTLRTIERVHRAKAKEMANWTAAMRRAEAAKFKAVKRVQEDMEVESLRQHLKTIRNRLDEKNKEIVESATFQSHISVVRQTYEQSLNDRGNFVRTPEDGAMHRVPVHDDDGHWSSQRNSTAKKQRLYNALHYSAIYEDGAAPASSMPVTGSHSASRQRVASPDNLDTSLGNVQLRGLSDTSLSSISASPQNPRRSTGPQQGGGPPLTIERAASPVRGTASSPLTASSYVIEL